MLIIHAYLLLFRATLNNKNNNNNNNV